MCKLDNGITRMGQINDINNTNYTLTLCVPDIDGKECQIDILSFLKVIRSIAPEEMDKLWEKARKDV